jgi:beta-1,4-N-acetylglucosaminyltransferase
VLAVLGSGGHTAEMLCVLSALRAGAGAARYGPVSVVAADSDAGSLARAAGAGWPSPGGYAASTPRLREVGAPLAALPAAAARAAAGAAWLLAARGAPDLLLVNGPGTCLPLALLVLAARALGVARTRVVFVESVCRVKTLSATGRILYAAGADAVLVQWPGLARDYPRAALVGGLL